MDKELVKAAVAAIRKEMRARVGKKLTPEPHPEAHDEEIDLVAGKALPEEGSEAEEAMESPKEEAKEDQGGEESAFHKMIAKALHKR